MVELISIAVLWSICLSKIHVPSQISPYMLWSQKLKIISKLSEWNCEEIFFPTNACFLMWSIKWRCKQINKKKAFFVTKIYFEGMRVGNVSITHRGHLFYFGFMDSYWLFIDFIVILHVVIWALLILGAHPFSGSNLS